ncbi:acyl-CoA thioesterase [Fulvivirga sp. M361]|uniref:acyl-CoA thioesterase n=1 Tax=Fulvivirga sp. M361 TaxID=2594266 RepID=UPI001179EECF|nr:acyl-CoA thioesterase [Fulvivirga sp. M361]TRX62619.1 acyl-CoA thioesterase [Fulvivirga sp. M361]
MEERIRSSETRQFKAVFPKTLNANDTLFGGQAMQWMDEVAYITATRFTRQKMFTVQTENIKFIKAITPDSIVEIIGRVEKVEVIKVKVGVEIFVEEMYGNRREKAISGIFWFASLDENRRPRRIDFSNSNRYGEQCLYI